MSKSSLSFYTFDRELFRLPFRQLFVYTSSKVFYDSSNVAVLSYEFCLGGAQKECCTNLSPFWEKFGAVPDCVLQFDSAKVSDGHLTN